MSAVVARRLALLLALTAAAPLGAQTDAPARPATAAQDPTDAKDKTPSDFARFVATETGGHFDVAVTTYRRDDGVTVRFFAAVHIADGAHYAELQRRFQGSGRLLYELVGPENYRPKKGEARDGFVSMIQNGMKNGLELEFQLDGIDYAAENFVHADMTPEEFAKSMGERGESLLMMMFTAGMNAQREMMKKAEEEAETRGDEPREKPVDLVAAFRSGEGRHQLRLQLAQQLESLEAMSSGVGTTLLEGRNEKCLQVLQREIADGQKDLGIYYGAAHLAHMEKRLCDDLGFRKVDHEWLVAWDCTKRADPKVDREVWRQRREVKNALGDLRRSAAEWVVANGEAGAKPTKEQHAAQFEKMKAAGEVKGTFSATDPWGRDYEVIVIGFGCDVRSLGEDGLPETADDLHALSPKERRRLESAWRGR